MTPSPSGESAQRRAAWLQLWLSPLPRGVISAWRRMELEGAVDPDPSSILRLPSRNSNMRSRLGPAQPDDRRQASPGGTLKTELVHHCEYSDRETARREAIGAAAVVV